MKHMQSMALAIVRCYSLFKKSRGMRLLGGISCAVLCSSLIGCRLQKPWKSTGNLIERVFMAIVI